MANTLNLGNGNWATKEDSLLAYNSENGNYKPLPFDFTRASSATVVNKAGLIETVGSGEARIDFKDDAKGALLLEPQRTNIIAYSEDFSNAYWTKSGSSIISNQVISPDGTLNADKLVEGTNNGVHKIVKPYTGISGTNTCSIFVKPNGVTKIGITSTESVSVLSSFDLSNGTLISSSSDDYSITPFANGWFRISSTDIGGNRKMAIFLLDDTGNYSYQGDGTRCVYIFGAQLEQGSYATSYIPTQGSAVTRSADASSQTPPSGIIGQTEGAMFLETSKWVESNNGRFFSISDGTTSNYIIIIQNNTFSNYAVLIKNGGILQLAYSATNALPNNSKIAISYKLNDFVVSVNGEIVHTDTSGTLPSTSKIYIGSRENGTTTYYSSNPIKDARLYNTRLSNAELQALTT